MQVVWKHEIVNFYVEGFFTRLGAWRLIMPMTLPVRACAKEGGGRTKGCFVFTVTTREAFKRETVGDRTNRKRCDAAIR